MLRRREVAGRGGVAGRGEGSKGGVGRKLGREGRNGVDIIRNGENRQREVGRKRGGREGRARIQFTHAVY